MNLKGFWGACSRTPEFFCPYHCLGIDSFCSHIQMKYMHITTNPWFQRARHSLQQLAPYAVLLALPGGSLLAPALWVYRHWQHHGEHK